MKRKWGLNKNGPALGSQPGTKKGKENVLLKISKKEEIVKLKCSTCGIIKESRDFYLSNKYQCKKCINEINSEWRKKNPTKYAEYARRHKEIHPVEYRKYHAKYQREWVRKNPDKAKKSMEKYRNSPKYKKRISEYRKNHTVKRIHDLELEKLSRILNPEIKSASNFIYRNTKTGKINRPDTCSVCGEKRRIVAHHEDYNFPFEIDWVCDPCHKRIHKEKRRKENEQNQQTH